MECECAHVNTFVHANDITINRDTFQLALFQALQLIPENWSGPGTEANSQSNQTYLHLLIRLFVVFQTVLMRVPVTGTNWWHGGNGQLQQLGVWQQGSDQLRERLTSCCVSGS